MLPWQVQKNVFLMHEYGWAQPILAIPPTPALHWEVNTEYTRAMFDFVGPIFHPKIWVDRTLHEVYSWNFEKFWD